MITVGIPNYNYGRFIGETIDSVLSQDHDDYEVVVYDDASTDDSVRRIKRKYGQKVKVIQGKKNVGLGAGRNQLIKFASGDYIFFLDSDDLMAPGALKCLSEASKGYDMIFGLVDSFSSNTDPAYKRHLYVNEAVKRYLHKRSIYLLAQIMPAWNRLCKTSFLRQNSIKFSEHRIMEDALFAYLLASCKPKVNFVEKVVVRIRNHPGSLSDYGDTQKISEVVEVTDEIIKCGNRYPLWSRLRLAGNNLVYFLINNVRNDLVFKTVVKEKKKISLFYRVIISLKLFYLSKDPRYFNFIF